MIENIFNIQVSDIDGIKTRRTTNFHGGQIKSRSAQNQCTPAPYSITKDVQI